MITHNFHLAPSSVSLSDEQRVLLEQVSASPGAFSSVRRRAQALLMLDQGLPVGQITAQSSMDRRTIHSLITRHRTGGVKTALLGQRSSLERRQWLALSPMSH
ncbi:helix-turn-helix domain-containing protein [Prosthecobacter dejongeii]|nr:helix-turn-helix domain-containing protein [Prosthecobacter dejongeii]